MPRLFMERRVLEEVLKSLTSRSFGGWIYFNLYGESLLDPKLEEWLTLFKGGLPGARLAVFTNGDELTVRRYLDLKQAGMDELSVSVHSPGLSAPLAATLEELRRDHPGLYTVSVTDYHALYGGGENRLGVLNNKGGLADVKRRPPLRCRDIESAAVDCLGNVLLCCNDCTSSYIFGNAAQKNLCDIWNDPLFTAVRRSIMRGGKPFDICKRCMGPGGRTVEIPAGAAPRLPKAFTDLEPGLSAFRKAARARTGEGTYGQ
jgi:MoaA/NifB/PqqE/SkfB family radical SAM enzyme